MDNPLPPTETNRATPPMPSPKAQSWGAVISIVVIVLMIIIGAFYSWGKRIAENPAPPSASTTGQ